MIKIDDPETGGGTSVTPTPPSSNKARNAALIVGAFILILVLSQFI